jgi:anti-anti-sigma factor
VVVHAHHANAGVLSVVGELDARTAPRFVSQAADALRDGAQSLLIELGDVPFVDAAGIAALLNVLRRVRSAGAAMVLVGVQPHVRDALDVTRLDQQFTFAPTLADAALALARES